MGNLLVVTGLILAAIGVGLNLLNRLGWFPLPGDILIQRGNFTFFFPLVSSIVISLLLTLLLNLFLRPR